MKKITLFMITLATIGLSNVVNAQTVKDIDGNVYNPITIGTQIWMKENLKTTKLNDGTAITLISDKINHLDASYCWYDNNATKYKQLYGALYNFPIVATGKLCPSGWHVPSFDEFGILIAYLGGTNFAADGMKEADTTNWKAPNANADNSSGFTALPAGNRIADYGIFDGSKVYTYFWSSTQSSSQLNNGTASNIVLWYNSEAVEYYSSTVRDHYSVRCLKGNASIGIKENNDNSRFALSPNPSNGKFTITMEDVRWQMADGKLAVYNVLGERVYASPLTPLQKRGEWQIDLSALPAGIYFLQLNTGEEIVNRKLVKE